MNMLLITALSNSPSSLESERKKTWDLNWNKISYRIKMFNHFKILEHFDTLLRNTSPGNDSDKLFSEAR
jgi:hypothetical protein